MLLVLMDCLELREALESLVTQDTRVLLDHLDPLYAIYNIYIYHMTTIHCFAGIPWTCWT